MKQRILSILNVKPSESKQVFDLLSVQFFIGLATAFLNVIALTLFIYDFPVDKLPYVYLSVALGLVLQNVLYEKLEHSVSPLKLLKVVILIAIILLITLWCGLNFGNRHDFIFILLVFNTLIYMLTGYAFWGLVSLLFNVRESRRVFSIVGSGDIPAKLLGYMLAPLLRPILGESNLIWFAIVALLLALYQFNKVIRKRSWDNIRKRSGHSHHQHLTHSKTNIVTFFFENRLIFAISLLSILSYNVFVLIDYTFISQVKTKFENIEDLSLYVAVFFAVGRIIALVFKLIFTSRVIEKLGVISSLFITPIALFLFCMLFFIYEGHANYNVFIFGMMALLTEVLRSTMQEPVFFILFQPLKEKLRLKGHIIAKGYTLPPSLMVVGISLLLLYRWNISISILFTIKTIIINLAVWVVVIFLVRSTYLHTLYNSIKKGFFSSDDKYIYDGNTIDILVKKVAESSGPEVIYSLDLLKKANYADLENLLQQQLLTKNSEVKKYALAELDTAGKADNSLLKKLLQQETNADIKQRILSLLCKLDPDFLHSMAENMGSEDFDTKKTVIVHLLNQAEFYYLLKAGNEMNQLINSNNPEEKKLAIEIISQLKHVQFTKVLSNLMNDEDALVRRSAVMAAGKLKMNSLLPQLLKMSEDQQEKFLVIKSLQQYGDQLFEDISKLSPDTISKHTPELVKIATNIKGDHCKEFLLKSLKHLNEQTGKTIQALWAQNYEPYDSDAIKQFNYLMHSYLKLGKSKVHDYHSIPRYSYGTDIVKISLINEIKTDLTLALKVCSMIYKKEQINRILELIEMDKSEKLFNAIEMIDIDLPKKIAREFIYLFDFILDPHDKKADLPKTATLAIFEKVYQSDAFAYNPWTKAIMIYNSWKNSIEEELAIVKQKNIEHPHYIIKETKDFVLHQKN